MSNIPPAPPLPSVRQQSNTARSAFARFVTQPFTRPSQQPRQDGLKPTVSLGHHHNYPGNNFRPSSSQHSSLTTRGAEITSLDKNKNGTHAVLAGRNVLKTIRVDGASCTEETDIRAALVTQDVSNASKPLDIYDVKWSQGEYGSYIATATGSGKIVVYDITAHGIESRRMHEHSRPVFKLAVNPHSSPLLLSASHDANVILWDLRDARPSMRISSRDKYKNSSGAVRDVKWSPTDGTEFAFSTDMGSVQKWDFRHNGKAKLKINAHEKYCTAIDWHPDGKHLMSAGLDKWIKIWDFASGSKRQRAQWSIRTPYPVANARWRPEYWQPEEHGNGKWQCTQIVTSYDRQFSPVVHLWDFHRPNVPYREMYWWNSPPSDMLWQNQRFLWTVDRDGVFQQGDIHYAPKVIDRRPMQAFALSPAGEICVFSGRRPRQRLADVRPPIETANDENQSQTLVERITGNKSATNTDLDHNLLSTSYKRNQHRSMSASHAKSTTSTPPSYSEVEMHRVTWLNDSLSNRRDLPASYSQVAYRGYIDGTLNTPNFTYLAQKYKTAVLPSNPSIDSFLHVGRIFEQNALYAQKTGAYRVAQTWRVFKTLVTHELQLKAEENRKVRLMNKRRINLQRSTKGMEQSQTYKVLIEDKHTRVSNQALRTVQLLDPGAIESSSNMQTPLAKAQVASSHTSIFAEASLPNPENDQLQLSPTPIDHDLAAFKGDLGTVAQAQSDTGAFLSQERPWFPAPNNSNVAANKVQNWSAGSRQPLDFGYPSTSPQTKLPPRLERHDSNDSFGMFSASSGSQVLGTSFKSGESVKQHQSSPDRPSDSRHSNGQMPPEYFSSSSAKNGDAKGNLSWMTSSSSMDFGGRGYSIDSELIEERRYGVQDDHSEPDDTLLASVEADENEGLILTDFTNQVVNTDAQPAHAAQMLDKLYQYYTLNTPNAQAIHHIAMIVKPLLASKHDVSTDKASLKQISIPEAKIAQEEAILHNYYDQLQSLQIHNPSVALARDAQQQRSQPIEGFSVGSQIGLVCLGCSKPINNALSRFRCENCGKRQSNCPICWQKYPAYAARSQTRKSASKIQRSGGLKLTHESIDLDLGKAQYPDAAHAVSVADVVLTDTTLDDLDSSQQSNYAILWQSCFVCGHGAHAACLQHIQNDPKIGGKCPTDGCLCDCIPGTYRTRLNRETAEDTRRRKGSISWVRGDTASMVPESGAVKGARSLLDREHRENSSGTASGTSVSTAATSTGLDRPKQQEEKRVRVVEPKSRRG